MTISCNKRSWVFFLFFGLTLLGKSSLAQDTMGIDSSVFTRLETLWNDKQFMIGNKWSTVSQALINLGYSQVHPQQPHRFAISEEDSELSVELNCDQALCKGGGNETVSGLFIVGEVEVATTDLDAFPPIFENYFGIQPACDSMLGRSEWPEIGNLGCSWNSIPNFPSVRVGLTTSKQGGFGNQKETLTFRISYLLAE